MSTSLDQPPKDPTIPPRPQVRQVSRLGLAAAILGLALLFVFSTVFMGSRAQSTSARKPAAAPANPATDQTIQNLLSAAVREARENDRRRQEERERERLLSEQLALLEEAPADPYYDNTRHPAEDQHFAPAAYRDREAEMPIPEHPQAHPRLSPAESRLLEAQRSAILTGGLTPSPGRRDTPGERDANLGMPPIEDLAQLLAPFAPPPTPLSPPPAAAPLPDTTSPRLTPRTMPAPTSLLSGSIIPATLTSKIISDLPGPATAIVSHDVYDTLTGKLLLIPRGSRLFGRYDSEIAYGQDRLGLTWSRLTLPDGTSFLLDSAPSTDSAGAAGVTDHVNRHIGRLAISTTLLSLFSAGAQLSQPVSYGLDRAPSASEIGAGALGQRLGDVSSSLIERELRVKPTITIDPGTAFSIVLTADIEFPD